MSESAGRACVRAILLLIAVNFLEAAPVAGSPLVGACCIGGGSCEASVDLIDCVLMEGAFQGAGSICPADLADCFATGSGDINGDGFVGRDDGGFWAECLGGPNESASGACEELRLTPDERIDLRDFAAFQCRVGVCYSPDQGDADSDGVADGCDVCAMSNPFEIADDRGCVPSQLDTDDDGVNDAQDRCPHTPPGTAVDFVGCSLTGGPDCGNGVIDKGESCDDGGESAECDGNCTIVQCGDGYANASAGEECDDGNLLNGDGCTRMCLLEPDPIATISADACAGADAIEGEGIFGFNNYFATTDGSPSSVCLQFGSDALANDVWGCWTPSCSGTAIVKTCGITFVDTKIAAYAGCDCPAGDETILACNDDRCDTQSVVPFEVVAGQQYLIRIGTFPGERGNRGLVSIECGFGSCGQGVSCFTNSDVAGCDDEPCCEAVCAVDPFCCDVQWDETCAEVAQGICGAGFNACLDAANTCDTSTQSPDAGCNDLECCNTVCRNDPFCCLSHWDDLCVGTAAYACPLNCGRGAGVCNEANGTPGCEDESCCTEVCSRDPFCCTQEWDFTCAEEAAEFCGS